MPYCIHENCTTQPSYNKPGEKVALYCKAHAKEDMVNVKSKTCIAENCSTIPHFNKPGEKVALYCKAHAKEDMVNVKNKTCIAENCTTIPSYNKPGEKVALYCKAHAKEDMIDVKHKTCLIENCSTIPIYNKPGEKVALYCKAHAKEDMINVKDKTCAFENCTILPSYNKPGEKVALYCKAHAIEDMVNVKNKTCIAENCTTQPHYNKPGEKVALYCAKHRLEGMRLTSDKTCVECTALSIYGIAGKKATHCEAHKKPNQVCISDLTKCSKCENKRVVLYKNKNYCLDCCPCPKIKAKISNICQICDPDLIGKVDTLCTDCAKLKKCQQVKEWATVLHLRRTIKTKFVHDQSAGDCTRRRPDAYFNLDRHVVIVEIDENQHRGYAESCECARISEIVATIGGRPIIFIRFNPDVIKHNNKIQNIALSDRLNYLTEVVKREIITIPDKFSVKVIQLYYDCNENTLSIEQTMDITHVVAV